MYRAFLGHHGELEKTPPAGSRALARLLAGLAGGEARTGLTAPVANVVLGCLTSDMSPRRDAHAGRAQQSCGVGSLGCKGLGKGKASVPPTQLWLLHISHKNYIMRNKRLVKTGKLKV